MEFLEFQRQHPWRFSFAEITARPEPDFFEMQDVFTDESYLLYSPSMTNILETQNPALWFNLITFNGECRQTYGPIGAYTAFQPQDIHFFAMELNRGKGFEDGRELMKYVESNPAPYMYLFSGTNQPITFHKNDQIVQAVAEYLDDSFDSEVFGSDFKVEYSRDVYKLSLKGWDEFPHYTAAYFDEKEELLYLYSMTDRGFRQLVDRLNRCGYRLSHEPDIRVNMAMAKTAGDILKKKIELNRYEKLFSKNTPGSDDSEGLKEINAMLAELIPYLNTGQNPDLDALAAKYGQDPGNVKEIYEELKKKLKG